MKNKKTAGIICEYNPFHSGHRYQIEKIREMGYENIVCVMSGNTVQRGEFACLDKYTRAKIAIENSVDLVLELPYPYSSSSAENYALAGIRILIDAKVDAVCFGSECGDIERLKKAAYVCDSREFAQEYKNAANSDKGTAQAYFETYKKIANEDFDFSSNDILAIAYLRALKKEKSNIIPIAIKRQGSEYKDEDFENSESFPSAEMIRKCIAQYGISRISEEMMPKKAIEIIKNAIEIEHGYADISNISKAIIANLRLKNPSEISKYAENSGGLAERICNFAKTATEYNELIEKCVSKKYPKARIKRAVIFALTGVKNEDLKRKPSYSLVLGLNSAGREILSTLRRQEGIRFITKPSDYVLISEKAVRQGELSNKSDSLFTLATEQPSESAAYLRKCPFVSK